jgi:hypothetical protein
MYCRKCRHEHQPIHKKIEREFSAFIKSNRKWLDQIDEGQIISLPGDADDVRCKTFALIPGKRTKFTIYNNNLLDDPYNVKYVGMRDYGEGSMIEFMDDNMDKIFSYYDVM